jgi:hypothetical protein
VLYFPGMLYYGKNDRHRISDMTQTWARLESASLPGGHRLEAWLGGDERGAFFRTAPGSAGTCTLVKLVPEGVAAAGTQLALWQRTRRLDHPNLLRLLDCGRTNITGEAYLYAVFEYPDDRLDMAMEQSPLSEPEVRAVLAALAEGLRYLHAQGLVHGSLDAGHVVAVGDCIKLSTDSLRESGGGEAGQAEDRWMLAKLTAALQNSVEQMPAPTAPMAAVPAPAAHAETPAETPAETRPRTDRLPVPRWIYFGVGGLLLLIVWLNVGRRAGPERQPATAPGPVASGPVASGPVASNPVAPSPVAPSPVAPAAKVLSGQPPKPVFRQPESEPAPHPARTGRAMWRVIAYTYTSRAVAEKKVRAINEKWPDLRPQVFAPGGAAGMYLVALGGRMTREEALNLQRRAQGKGLPRDTYVQNYLE